MGLKTELHLAIGAAAVVTLAGLGTIAGFRLSEFYRHEAVAAKGRAMARALASPCAWALARGDRVELDRIIEDLQRSEIPTEKDREELQELDLVHIAVVSTARTVVASRLTESRRPGEEKLVLEALTTPKLVITDEPEHFGPAGESVVAFAAPLRTNGTLRGVLWFELSLERARTAFQRTLALLLAGTTAGAGVIWFFLYKMLKFRILKPIFELSRGIDQVQKGDLEARVTLARKDEFGNLVENFNAMVAMLRERPKLEQRADEAERLEIAHRRLAAAHRELADAHAELEANKEQLAITLKQASLGRLVRAVAHELKNPLNSASNVLPSIEGALGRLQTEFKKALGESSVEVKEDLEDLASALAVLRRSVTRAVSIIHDLQGFSQLGEADLAAVDLKRLVDDAVLACATVLGPSGRVSVDVDVADDAGNPITLRGFPTLLGQVFVNLITNASQAIQGPGKISIRGRPSKGERVRVEVADTGPGIPAEHMPKLFEPFFTTKGVTGTGLGLALCYAYVEKHGGTIEARSEVGKGATFLVDLPLRAEPREMGPRASAVFDGPRDSVAAAARRRGA